MRRINSKVFWLASFLIQGIYAVQANELGRTMNVENQISDNLVLQQDVKALNSGEFSVKNPTHLSRNILLGRKLTKGLSIPRAEKPLSTNTIKPISLAEVEELIEKNSPRLKIMKLREEQAKELLKSKIATWYPTVSLSANGLPEYFSTDQDRNPDFGSDTKGQQWRTSLSAQVQWKLIDPGRVPEIAAARDGYEQAKYSYLIVLRDLRLRAAKEYFFLQRADEGVRIGKQSMKASLISLRDARARFEAGVATRLEVLEAETQLARDKQLLTRKLGDQKITRRKIATTLNLDPKVTPIASTAAQVIGTWNSSLKDSVLAAYSFREELNRILLDISINNNNANGALAQSQPILSLVNSLTYSKNYGQTGIADDKSIDMDDYTSSISNSIGLNATWNIFDGGRSKALYNYHKLKSTESKQDFILKKNNIRQEVEESFFNLQTANQDIATTTREVLASRESLRLARLRFQAGVTTQREVVNNQRDLTQAEVRYSDAITTYNTSISELKRRTGLDHIKTCKPRELSSEKPENNKLIDIPIEPFPLIPACEASTIKREN